MENEITKFRILLDQTEKRFVILCRKFFAYILLYIVRVIIVSFRCVKEYDHLNMNPWISRIRLNKETRKECEKFAWGEVSVYLLYV